MNKICGIYKITSPTGKIYIGQSIDLNKRKAYYKNLRCKNQTKIYNSILKYGWDAHTFEIIHECDKSELNEFEKHYIKLFDAFNSMHGMNLTSGGDNNIEISDETRVKRILAATGKKHTDETKAKIIESNKRRIISDETKLKMSIANKGKKHKSHTVSEESKLKMSIAKKGKILSEEHKLKISLACKGITTNKSHKHSEKTKLYLSQIRTRYKHKTGYHYGNYEIYNNENKLVYKFNEHFINKMNELGLPPNTFKKSYQTRLKINKGNYLNWYAIKL
jgi:group I intron endonuclease